MHSQSYRRASDFAGKRVALVGGGLSGADLAHQLVPVAKEVVFCIFSQFITEFFIIIHIFIDLFIVYDFLIGLFSFCLCLP
jgi:hypothetical protein